jgi:hypothetical protein
MDRNSLYLSLLSAMFVFSNSVRILTYVPTILKLKRPGASAKDYSLATWASWVFSNGFFALYLWEQSQRDLNAMVVLNCGNTLMCLVTCYYIVKLRDKTGARVGLTGSDAFRVPLGRKDRSPIQCACSNLSSRTVAVIRESHEGISVAGLPRWQ